MLAGIDCFFFIIVIFIPLLFFFKSLMASFSWVVLYYLAVGVATSVSASAIESRGLLL